MTCIHNVKQIACAARGKPVFVDSLDPFGPQAGLSEPGGTRPAVQLTACSYTED